VEVAMLAQSVTKDLVFQRLDKLSPNELVEVAQFIEFLLFREEQPISTSTGGEHVAFGIWANRPEANDPVAFASKLRESIEKRTDA
jgi:hypothetical protein